MFVDEDLQGIVLPSTWQRERSLAENETQTKEIRTEENACQSIKRKTKEVQTDTEPEREVDPTLADDPELAAFLWRVESQLSEILRVNSRSTAFDDYVARWEEDVGDVECVHTLKNPTLSDELHVTGVCWNSTGSSVGVAYGCMDHEDWCTHKSAISTWNIDRHAMNPNKPDLTIDVSSCVMCLAYHPLNPSLLAAGTFNGEVLIWDLSRDDEMLISTSGMSDDTHREPVSKLQWVLDSEAKSKKHQVVSVSTDGKILLWRMRSTKPELKVEKGFMLMTESLPASVKQKSKQGDKEMGVTCISYSPIETSTFLIGSDSGGVFKCSTMARGTPANSQVESSVPLFSPVTLSFNPHSGPVYSVECSPFHRNLFLSCGSDTSARIYSMLETDPVITIQPNCGYLYSAKWSPCRPLVFAVATENGSLLIYDLKHNRGAPRFKIDAGSQKPIHTMQFNPKTHTMVTGDSNGQAKIWKLGNDLTTQTARDMELLEEIASTSVE